MSTVRSVCEVPLALILDLATELTSTVTRLSIRAIPLTEQSANRNLVEVAGGIALEDATIEHLNAMVAPQVLQIASALGFARCGFDLAIVPIGAASGQGQELIVSGHSLDFPVFAGALGALTGARPVEGILATGYCGPEGTLRMVEYLDLKLLAAASTPGIHTIVIPSLTADPSVAALTPDYADRIRSVRGAISGRIRVIEAADIADAVALTIDPRAAVLASFRGDYFQDHGASASPTPPEALARVVAFLKEGNAPRFWAVLEAHLMAQDHTGAAELLEAYLAYCQRSRTYPDALGSHLQELFWSIPRPYLHALPSALTAFGQTLDVARLAATSEQRSDALLLIDILQGRHTARESCHPSAVVTPKEDPDAQSEARVAWTLQQISAEQLDTLIVRPLANARETFALETIQPPSHDAYEVEKFRFWVHTSRASGLFRLSRDECLIAAEAHEAFSAAYAQQGGETTAEALARNGLHGGFPMVLDTVIEWLSNDLKARHVNRVLREAMDPLAPADQVSFVRALMHHLGDQLPPDLRAQPPEFFVNRIEVLVRRYVQAVDRLVEAFRGL